MANEIEFRDVFLQSVDRCAESEDFIPSFYERFMSISDEIKDKFRNTKFEDQNRMLLRSLMLAAGATAGDQQSLQDLRERAESHDRHHLNIEPRLYDLWLSTIIETASVFDEEWSDEVGEAWRAILGHVIRHMVKRY